jgi:hypothetical protein
MGGAERYGAVDPLIQTPKDKEIWLANISVQDYAAKAL